MALGTYLNTNLFFSRIGLVLALAVLLFLIGMTVEALRSGQRPEEGEGRGLSLGV